jgi:hypothetical protein
MQYVWLCLQVCIADRASMCPSYFRSLWLECVLHLRQTRRLILYCHRATQDVGQNICQTRQPPIFTGREGYLGSIILWLDTADPHPNPLPLYTLRGLGWRVEQLATEGPKESLRAFIWEMYGIDMQTNVYCSTFHLTIDARIWV